MCFNIIRNDVYCVQYPDLDLNKKYQSIQTSPAAEIEPALRIDSKGNVDVASSLTIVPNIVIP